MVSLDVPTLMFAGGLVSVLCATALFFVWFQGHVTSAALWWSGSSLALGAGISLIAIGFVIRTPPVFMAGLAMLIVSAALNWGGLRVFERRRNYSLLLVGGPLAWALLALAVGQQFPSVPAIANTILLIAYYSGSISELVRHGDERLRVRPFLIAVVSIHMAMVLLAIPATLIGSLQEFTPPPVASLFGMIHLETIVFVTASTFLLIAMKRERSEQQLMHEAQTDALTGLANRRAFTEMAERVAERCKRRGDSIAVIVFDLDRFKRVNDTFGHAFGDGILRIFAKSARDSLRPGDLVSRVGGEEFFAVLSGADAKEGCATAERVRAAFAEAARVVDGRNVGATVSAGVAACEDARMPVASLIEKADAALYRAKLGGRDRVACGDEPVMEKFPRLVRVA